MKIHKNRNIIKVCFIICGHIWHIKTSKCVYWLDTESVKVWWRYNNSDMSNRQLDIKILWKTIQNQEIFHKFQSHLACQLIKVCVLIRYTFCESFVMICVTKRKCHSFLWNIFWHKVVFPKKKFSKIKNSTTLG